MRTFENLIIHVQTRKIFLKDQLFCHTMNIIAQLHELPVFNTEYRVQVSILLWIILLLAHVLLGHIDFGDPLQYWHYVDAFLENNGYGSAGVSYSSYKVLQLKKWICTLHVCWSSALLLHLLVFCMVKLLKCIETSAIHPYLVVSRSA